MNEIAHREDFRMKEYVPSVGVALFTAGLVFASGYLSVNEFNLLDTIKQIQPSFVPSVATEVPREETTAFPASAAVRESAAEESDADEETPVIMNKVTADQEDKAPQASQDQKETVNETDGVGAGSPTETPAPAEHQEPAGPQKNESGEEVVRIEALGSENTGALVSPRESQGIEIEGKQKVETENKKERADEVAQGETD